MPGPLSKGKGRNQPGALEPRAGYLPLMDGARSSPFSRSVARISSRSGGSCSARTATRERVSSPVAQPASQTLMRAWVAAQGTMKVARASRTSASWKKET